MKYSEETVKTWTAPLSDTEEQRAKNASQNIVRPLPGLLRYVILDRDYRHCRESLSQF